MSAAASGMPMHVSQFTPRRSRCRPQRQARRQLLVPKSGCRAFVAPYELAHEPLVSLDSLGEISPEGTADSGRGEVGLLSLVTRPETRAQIIIVPSAAFFPLYK